MAAPKRNSSVVSLRAKKTVATPPLVLGFASLVTPDTYNPDKPTFKLNGHMGPEAITAFQTFLKDKVLTDDAVEAIRDEMIEVGMKRSEVDKVKVVSAEDWLEAKLKEPKEKSRIQLPHIVISNRASFRKRDGEVVERTVSCWDGKNRKMNLPKLRLGMDSTIEVIVYPNLYFSKLDKLIQPSLKLVGVRVLKLERWGGQAAPTETDEDAIKEVLGEDFEADDLSDFMAGASDEDDNPPSSSDDSESAEDQAKGMF